MLGHACGKKVCPVYVGPPKLFHAIKRVVDCFKVLGESGGSDKIVDLAMFRKDLGEGFVY